MAFGNSTQTKPLTSTSGPMYFGMGEDGEEKSLSVGYLENNLSIGIFNLLPKNQQTEKSRFNYKEGHVIYIRGKHAKTLYRLVKEAQKCILNDEEVEDLSIASGSNLIEVSDGSKYNLKKSLTLAIYNNINPDKTAQNPAIFQFLNENIIMKYDNKTGSYKTKTIDSDVDYFMDQLHEFSKAINCATAHSIKKEMSYSLGKIVSRQIQCCKALGISTDPSSFAKRSWDDKQPKASADSVDSLEDALDDIE